MLETTHHVRSGLFIIKSGPGCSPYKINALNKIAVDADPGIPKESSGIIAPDTAALFAVSGAASPGKCPLPNFSGVLEIFSLRYTKEMRQ